MSGDSAKPNLINIGDFWLDKSIKISTSLRQDKGEEIFGGIQKSDGSKVAVRVIYGDFSQNADDSDEKLYQ